MSQVGVDLFEFSGSQYLVMVDRYSGYPFVKQLRSLTTSNITKILFNWFLDFGFPISIRSDGGPQFRSEFGAFCDKHNIKHELSSPYHAQSNGLAESAVKNVKYLLDKCKSSGESFDVAFSHWKATPRADGFSPSDMFLKRHIRTSLPSLHLDFDPDSATSSREQSRDNLSQSSPDSTLHPLSIGTTVYIQHPQSHNWTEKGTIVDIRPSGRSYNILLSNGKTILRNRRYLRMTPSLVSSLKSADSKDKTKKCVRFSFF